MGFLFELIFQAIGEFICGAIHRAVGTWGCAILSLFIIIPIALLIWHMP